MIMSVKATKGHLVAYIVLQLPHILSLLIVTLGFIVNLLLFYLLYLFIDIVDQGVSLELNHIVLTASSSQRYMGFN
jgi:hypothetical protein